ncbi:hypothetical protein Spb1_18580 [Planctopirus ephydatiae]|uniref:Uncharacterized protein n=1 Tax=Planctopirus ephydatiae TaxID=2528019 RepID=A0A518GMU5_9PLAN|nr:hypothetical protein Spb1_18580 [Planctopirus ephydatiae]
MLFPHPRAATQALVQELFYFPEQIDLFHSRSSCEVEQPDHTRE